MGFRRVRIRWFKIVSVKATSEKIENRWDKQPSIGNTRAECAELMERYKDLEPRFGIEQEYTLMKKGKVGEIPPSPSASTTTAPSQPHRVHTTAAPAQAAPSEGPLPTSTT